MCVAGLDRQRRPLADEIRVDVQEEARRVATGSCQARDDASGDDHELAMSPLCGYRGRDKEPEGAATRGLVPFGRMGGCVGGRRAPTYGDSWPGVVGTVPTLPKPGVTPLLG